MIKARIYHSSQRVFSCKILSTGEMVLATALGKLLKGGDLVVGDYVELELLNHDEYSIITVEERQNEIFRMIQREAKKKVNASNCDLIVIMVSVSFPQFKRGIVDRYLVRSEQWGIPAILIFNKIDELELNKTQSDLDWEFECERLKKLNIETFAVSALNPDAQLLNLPKKTSDSKNFTQLKNTLKNKTAIFMGQSGVGKSKLISLLSGGKIELLSQKLGKVNKGAHTTTWAELIDVDDFSLIDSPGIRSFSLEDIKKEDLLSYFPDLNEWAVLCKFPNCQHEKGVKGCYFYEHQDHPDAPFLFSRLESFHQILKEVEVRPSWEKN